MENEVVVRGLQIVPVIAAGLTIPIVWNLYGTYRPGEKLLTTYRELSGLVKEKQKESSHYRRMERWLLQNGATYHYGKGMTPTKFFSIRILLAMAGVLAFSGISVEEAVIAGLLLYLLPGWMLTYLNNRDNERLLPELKLVYNALELQIRAGVYVTDALAECYGSVRERRLKEALLNLAGDIVVRADIYQALDKFQSAFDNRYVDSLCITLIQAMESGQAVELLADIGTQIRDMEQALLERKKAALDRSITFYQLGILAVVLGIALYACVTHMLGAAFFF